MTLRSEFLRKCFLKRPLLLWNSLPRKIIREKNSYNTIKKERNLFLSKDTKEKQIDHKME